MEIDVTPAPVLAPGDHAAILALCSQAYEEDFAPYLALLGDAVHVIGRRDGAIISHAAWVTRWLQPGTGPLLRTAYIEAVATLPMQQGRGHATTILAALPPLLRGFDIAALSPSDTGFYARLGWKAWAGPLSMRTPAGAVATPGEDVMVLRLPRTPALDLAAALSVEYRDGDIW